MRKSLAALTILGLLLGGLAIAVHEAQPYYPGGADIVRLSADYNLKADGTLEVTETIDYNYGHLGYPLARVIQVRRPATDDLGASVKTPGTDRIWKVFDVTATDSSGAKVAVDLREMDPLLPPLTPTGIDGWNSRLSDLHIKVGDSLPYVTVHAGDKPVTRMARFVVRYKVRGALERASGGYELNWPDRRRLASGEQLDYIGVPVVDTRLATPSDPISPSCAGYRDAPGDWAVTPCAATTKTARETIFTNAQQGSSMTVVAGLPGDGFADGAALYDDSPAPVSAWIRRILVGALLVAALVVIAIWRRRAVRTSQPEN
ncbi:hypothetical protein GCM10029976_094750 [Kribbella albertanoniae]|uniref:DUF2207 domain-containing protein n=1 Tax=Kribbella albertanoniae TaxID=1266829 RepID=UPI0014055C3E|nr:DUF2207 domain-containing protein [Kribbella albertanoniae]